MSSTEKVDYFLSQADAYWAAGNVSAALRCEGLAAKYMEVK